MKTKRKMKTESVWRPVAGGLLCFILGSCASRPETTAESTDGKAGLRAEITTLEKRISERRSRLEATGGSRGHLGNDSSATAAPAAAEPAIGRCESVCQAAQEICSFHRRICTLAAEIDDAASAQSCQRAQRDCDDASSICGNCR
jgi:hypothetical protein